MGRRTWAWTIGAVVSVALYLLLADIFFVPEDWARAEVRKLALVHGLKPIPANEHPDYESQSVPPIYDAYKGSFQNQEPWSILLKEIQSGGPYTSSAVQRISSSAWPANGGPMPGIIGVAEYFTSDSNGSYWTVAKMVVEKDRRVRVTLAFKRTPLTFRQKLSSWYEKRFPSTTPRPVPPVVP